MYTETWMSYGPRDSMGWPTFVTQEARKWLTQKVREKLQGSGPMGLDLLYRTTWKYPTKDCPECLRNVAVYDAIYAVTHRAALEAGASRVFALEGMDKIKAQVSSRSDLEDLVLAYFQTRSDVRYADPESDNRNTLHRRADDAEGRLRKAVGLPFRPPFELPQEQDATQKPLPEIEEATAIYKCPGCFLVYETEEEVEYCSETEDCPGWEDEEW